VPTDCNGSDATVSDDDDDDDTDSAEARIAGAEARVAGAPLPAFIEDYLFTLDGLEGLQRTPQSRRTPQQYAAFTADDWMGTDDDDDYAASAATEAPQNHRPLSDDKFDSWFAGGKSIKHSTKRKVTNNTKRKVTKTHRGRPKSIKKNQK